MKQPSLALVAIFLLLLAGAWFIYSSHQAGHAYPGVTAVSPGANPGGTSTSTSDGTSAAVPNHPGASSASKAPFTPPPSGQFSATGVSQPPPVRVIPTSQQPQNRVVPAYAAPLSPGGNSAHADQDLEKINHMLRDYRTLMGENPVGTNAEIMKAILGDNPRKAQLLQDGVTLNGKSEIVDPWGNPYFFHQLSGTFMEVRSAGPDGIMWTSDDIIRK